jgi:hypothetical protein
MHTNAVTLLDYMGSDEAHARAAHKVPGAFLYPTPVRSLSPGPLPRCYVRGVGAKPEGARNYYKVWRFRIKLYICLSKKGAHLPSTGCAP